MRLRLRLRARLRLGLIAAGIDTEDAGDHIFGGLAGDARTVLLTGALGSRLAIGLLLAHLLHAAKFGLALLAVVAAALVGIAQQIIRAAGFGEAHGRVGVVMILVGMHGFRHRTPRRLDFVLAGIPLHAKNRIGITHN